MASRSKSPPNVTEDKVTQRKPLNLIKKITRNQFNIVQMKRLIGKDLVVLRRVAFNKQVEMNNAMVTLADLKPNQILNMVGVLRKDGTVEIIKGIRNFLVVNMCSYDDIKKKNLNCTIAIQQYNDLTNSERMALINGQ